jgi:hypothetical protein
MGRTVSAPADLHRTIADALTGGSAGLQRMCERRQTRMHRQECRLQLKVGADRVVVSGRTSRQGGAAGAMAIADRVAILLRERVAGQVRLDAPSIDVDGRDPNYFRIAVTVLFRIDVPR